MNTGENQRIKLTKRLLRLLAKKDIQHITVSELCDGVEINRSTLYNHYVCPAEALAKIECGLCEGALLCQKPGEKTAHHSFLSNGTYQMVRQRLPEDIPKPSQRDGRTDISGGDSGLGPAIWKNAGDAPPVIRPPPVRVPAQLRGQSNRSQQGTITAK